MLQTFELYNLVYYLGSSNTRQEPGYPNVYICCSIPSYPACPSGYTPVRDYTYNNIVSDEFD